MNTSYKFEDAADLQKYFLVKEGNASIIDVNNNGEKELVLENPNTNAEMVVEGKKKLRGEFNYLVTLDSLSRIIDDEGNNLINFTGVVIYNHERKYEFILTRQGIKGNYLTLYLYETKNGVRTEIAPILNYNEKEDSVRIRLRIDRIGNKLNFYLRILGGKNEKQADESIQNLLADFTLVKSVDYPLNSYQEFVFGVTSTRGEVDSHSTKAIFDNMRLIGCFGSNN